MHIFSHSNPQPPVSDLNSIFNVNFNSTCPWCDTFSLFVEEKDGLTQLKFQLDPGPLCLRFSSSAMSFLSIARLIEVLFLIFAANDG